MHVYDLLAEEVSISLSTRGIIFMSFFLSPFLLPTLPIQMRMRKETGEFFFFGEREGDYKIKTWV